MSLSSCYPLVLISFSAEGPKALSEQTFQDFEILSLEYIVPNNKLWIHRAHVIVPQRCEHRREGISLRIGLPNQTEFNIPGVRYRGGTDQAFQLVHIESTIVGKKSDIGARGRFGRSWIRPGVIIVRPIMALFITCLLCSRSAIPEAVCATPPWTEVPACNDWRKYVRCPCQARIRLQCRSFRCRGSSQS